MGRCDLKALKSRSNILDGGSRDGKGSNGRSRWGREWGKAVEICLSTGLGGDSGGDNGGVAHALDRGGRHDGNGSGGRGIRRLVGVVRVLAALSEVRGLGVDCMSGISDGEELGIEDE